MTDGPDGLCTVLRKGPRLDGLTVCKKVHVHVGVCWVGDTCFGDSWENTSHQSEGRVLPSLGGIPWLI